MKKILTVFIAAVFIFQVGIFPVFAGNAGEGKKITAIGYTAPSSSTENETKDQVLLEEMIISDYDVEIQGGKYSYKLVIRADGTLSFDNDLEITYQGINGWYQLNYEIEETGTHIMIVTGYFENILAASPLLEKLSDENRNWVLSHVSGDSYSYQLNLRTGEGFTFTNTLRFLVDSEPYGYSLDCLYDLLTDNLSVTINKIT